jgi:hypothetical protein
MPGRCGGHVQYAKPLVAQSLTEVHILEPNGVKLLVKTAYRLPRIAAHHKEGSGRLIDIEGYA